MRKDFTILGIGVAIVGVVLILIALPTPICQPPNGTIVGGCGHNTIYTEFYSGIILMIIGAILVLLSILMKSKPSTDSALGMIQTHRLAGIAIFLWGFYLFYTSLTASYMEQPPSLILSFYLPLVVGLASIVFGIYLIIRKKPILQDPEEEAEVHQQKINTEA